MLVSGGTISGPWVSPTSVSGRPVNGIEGPRARARGPSSRKPSGTGFTLIEVLVALLVLSFGLLAGAALQLHALQATHSAYQHSLASVLATDAGERLWVGLAQGRIDTDWLADWRERRRCETDDPHACLPALEVTIEPLGTGQRITLSWAEARFGDEPDGRAERDYRIEVLPERLP